MQLDRLQAGRQRQALEGIRRHVRVKRLAVLAGEDEAVLDSVRARCQAVGDLTLPPGPQHLDRASVESHAADASFRLWMRLDDFPADLNALGGDVEHGTFEVYFRPA